MIEDDLRKQIEVLRMMINELMRRVEKLEEEMGGVQYRMEVEYSSNEGDE